jgi:heterodisulfide reductase subunit A
MFSIKEAMLAKSKSAEPVDTVVFYMDLRTFGKDFQRYRDLAEESGVRFVRSRVHSIEPQPDGSLRIRYVDTGAAVHEEQFDVVVLAAGQKPPEGSDALAQLAGFELDSAGFCRTENFFTGRTTKEGVFAGGSFAGLRDISESIIQAGSAALEASKLIVSRGGGLGVADRGEPALPESCRELPKPFVALCTCGGALAKTLDLGRLGAVLAGWDPAAETFQIDRACTQAGRDELARKIEETRSNMVVIGACMPCVYGKMTSDLGKATGLSPALIDFVDIHTPALAARETGSSGAPDQIECALKMSLGRLRGADPTPFSYHRIVRKALVVGGGVAGMTAALAIAEHEFKVDLVEKEDLLGGQVRSLFHTIDGVPTAGLVDTLAARVESHVNVTVHRRAEVVDTQPHEGLSFLTTIETGGGETKHLDHGVTILATGGKEAPALGYCYGKSESVLTQHELEAWLAEGTIDSGGIRSVAMIQCAGSRGEGRNYCSRVCCSSALKNALYLKGKNPEIDIHIFYRDIMTYGFLEAYYTAARREGIIFIQYEPGAGPEVYVAENGKTRISARDPILGRQILLEPDLVVLSTGIDPEDHRKLAGLFGIDLNEDGFFRESEYKWQPVNSRKRGVFICGTAHSPRSIPESIAMAQAAAQRALSMLNGERIQGANTVAGVRRSLCSLCERCVSACPYDARRRNDEEDVIEIDELACQGCGSCAAICPNSASVVRGFSDRQVMAMLDAALE